jgi:hypothetical protein
VKNTGLSSRFGFYAIRLEGPAWGTNFDNILVSAAGRRGAVANGYRPPSSKFHDVDQGREATASTTRDDVMISNRNH